MRSLNLVFLCSLFFQFISTSVFAGQCETIKKTPYATLQACDKLKILWLKGTPVERARAHGELLGRELTVENLNLFYSLSTRGIDPDSIQFKLVDWLLNRLIQWSTKDTAASYDEEIFAMAKSANLHPIKLKRAFALPDLAAFSWALLSRQGKSLPTQGCTSAIYSNASTGQFLQGRNLDFPGSPAFDQNPLLVVHLPSPGSPELKHVSVGSAGVQFSGITGFNEAGLTFSVHQNYTRLLSFKGVPMPYIGELVLRSARSLDEAIAIIKKNRPGPLWTFVISDIKTGQALSVDVSNTHLNIRFKKDDFFIQTNHLEDNLKKELSLMDSGTRQNSLFRYQKVLEDMKLWKNPKALNMAQTLAWQKNSQIFSPVSDLMKYFTIQAVIFEKSKRNLLKNFYVTMDSAPTPAGRWAKFRMEDFFQKSGSQNLEFQTLNFLQTSSSLRLRQQQWVRVYELEILRQYKEAVRLLEPLAHNPDSFLALSALQNKLTRPLDTLVSAQRGLQLAQTAITPELITQGLYWMEIVALIHLKKNDLVLNKAFSLSNLELVDPVLKIQVQKILKKQNPSSSSLSPGFDFFGGYLQGMPSRPSD